MHLVLAAILAGAASSGEGRVLYAERCASCHGANLQGSDTGPPLMGVSAGYVDFMLRTGRMPASRPTGEALEKTPRLDGGQIRALVAYVAAQSRGEQTLPRVAPGNVARGREIFAENCAQCHGVTAHGASVGYAIVAPSLMSATPEEIAEAVRSGPVEMPKFGPDVLSDADVNDVAAYVRFLQTDTAVYNPGGLQLANIGPVAEGFVAWVFGLGLLVLFIRRIGSTE